MINDNKEYEAGQPEDGGYIEIYSKTAIFWFSFFFSTIFGGIMLAINLRKAGLIKAMWSVLLFSTGYYIMAEIVVTQLLKRLILSDKDAMVITGVLTLTLNLIGGLILTSYHFKKYFPDDDYYPRSIQTPLLIALLLVVFFSMISQSVGIQI